MKRYAVVLVAAAVAWLAWEARQLRTGEPSTQKAFAADARLITKVCNMCAASATTTYAGVVIQNAGASSVQVTCSTAGGNTWPDAFDLEAKDADDHTWVTVQGFTTAVADGRDASLIGFAQGSQVRAVITDAAGQHSCFATIASIANNG